MANSSTTPITRPALDRSAVITRPMTADEAQMARAVACCPMLKHSQHRGSMRMLHARSLTDGRFITAPEAATLRACVIAFRAQLAAEVVAMARES